MEIVLAVPFAGALFFLGLLAGIRVSDRILRARERALAAARREFSDEHRRGDEPASRPLFLAVDADLIEAEIPGRTDPEDED